MSADDNEPNGTAPSSPRRTSRTKKKIDEDESTLPTTSASSPVSARKTSKKKAIKKKSPIKGDSDTEEKTDSKPKRKTKKTATSVLTKQQQKIKKTSPSPKRKATQNSDSDEKKAEKPAAKKAKKAPAHQVLTERDELPKLWDATKQPETSYTMKIASWNVAGLRALIKKTPNIIADICQQHNLDVLCLQETKLQESHVDDPKLKIPKLEEEGYKAYYSCSTAKKGYSGTAFFVRDRSKTTSIKQQATLDKFFVAKKDSKKKKKEAFGDNKASSVNNIPSSLDPKLLLPEKVAYKLGVDKHDAEGRVIIVDFPLFTLCNVYVPNSGQKLERLDYRVDEWDKDFLSCMQQKQKDRGVPSLWLGDLNVAHTNLEVWNDGAKHLLKQAGVTPQERASFQAQLDAGFVDVFRKLHPTAAGHYSYWSQRAGNREPNKGLRLDYFIGDQAFFDESSKVVARDSYMIPDQLGSDHCPVVLELEIKS